MALFQFKTWKRLRSRQLFVLILITNALAVAFEGYAQGVLGLTNASPTYLTSVYYLGAVFGTFVGGFIADKLGRVTGLQLGCLWCILGTALEAGTQNASMQLCARTIAGIGVGHMNVIAPTWTAEVSEAAHRGKMFSLVYRANYGGIAFAYWLEFGLHFIDGGKSEIQWRLPFAINGLFPLILFVILPFVPESPRYLLSKHRETEAIEILAATRADGNANDPTVRTELKEMKANIQLAEDTAERNSYIGMLTGRKSGSLHFARRTQLAFWLPCFTQIGTGIVSTTIYTPTLIKTSGWGPLKADYLSALNNTVGILGTIIAIYTIDPVGPRVSLLWGSLAQSVCMWIIGAMSVCTVAYPSHAAQFGAASVSFIFVFTLIYACTFLIINFNYASEIFPTEVRSHGMAFGIGSWAIGLGGSTLYSPKMFGSIGGYGFMIFGGLNLVWLVLVWLFLPETSGRSLEAIDLLFEANSPFQRVMEKHFQQKKRVLAENGGEYGEWNGDRASEVKYGEEVYEGS